MFALLLALTLPFGNLQDFEDAKKGFIAPLPNGGLVLDGDKVVWDLQEYQFLDEKVIPKTVNPSLFRQAKLLYQTGLFEVTPGIYQVRGLDLSNITFIEGVEGVIVVDPLISIETAKAALDLYRQERGDKKVSAVIYTHSHVDHYGGVRGVADEETEIIAPLGFLEEAVSENVLAGNAMSRRSTYMYGNLIPKSPTGQVSTGLGLTTSSGTVSLLPPTTTISKTGQTLDIDGVTFVFQLALGSEAPSEMHFYIPEYQALCTGENANHTLHNLYSLRGAKLRDTLAWSKYLNEALHLFGDEAEVFFAPHHWPTWGNENIQDHLKKQRDTYKYIHDQTLRLANMGYNATEIAEMLKLPKSLEMDFASKGYYGTLNHNIKAVYHYYLGFFDGNPATLHPLPPIEQSKQYVSFMGGSGKIMHKVEKQLGETDDRFLAEVMNHVIFSEPNNERAKKLQAKILTRMGYRQESGPWRNFYLTAAQELLEGVHEGPSPLTNSPDTIKAMSVPLLFDYMAVRLNGPMAEGKKASINWDITDTNEKYLLTLENSVLNYTPEKQLKDADATVSLTRDKLNQLLLGGKPDIKVRGSRSKVKLLLSLLDTPDFWFPIVTPIPPKDSL